MSDLLDVIKIARDSGNCERLVETVPYARFLGISVDTSRGELVGKLTFSDMLIGNPTLPALHGGTIAALLESTAIFTLLKDTDTAVIPKIINITVAYLRSGRPVDTFAHCALTKHGRRVAAVSVEAWQAQRSEPIATATAHFLLDPA
jgi:acyl-coenzyme A thioesterase PaaI-like protein